MNHEHDWLYATSFNPRCRWCKSCWRYEERFTIYSEWYQMVLPAKEEKGLLSKLIDYIF